MLFFCEINEKVFKNIVMNIFEKIDFRNFLLNSARTLATLVVGGQFSNSLNFLVDKKILIFFLGNTMKKL